MQSIINFISYSCDFEGGTPGALNDICFDPFRSLFTVVVVVLVLLAMIVSFKTLKRRMGYPHPNLSLKGRGDNR
jgi:DMSO/TMAO reductase YedYZ heme-binding membrane subunit